MASKNKSGALHTYQPAGLEGQARVYSEVGWRGASEAMLALSRQRKLLRAWTVEPHPDDDALVCVEKQSLYILSTVAGESVPHSQIEYPEGYYTSPTRARNAALAAGKAFPVEFPVGHRNPDVDADIARLKNETAALQNNVSRINKGYVAYIEEAARQIAALQGSLAEALDRIQTLERVQAPVRPPKPPKARPSKPPGAKKRAAPAEAAPAEAAPAETAGG